jgi:hypothetical protein
MPRTKKTTMRVANDEASKDGNQQTDSTGPLFDFGRRANEDTQHALLHFAFSTTPQEYTYWELIFWPIQIMAEHMDMTSEIHEVALPLHEGEVKSWNAREANWVPPIPRITTYNMQNELCKDFARLYKATLAQGKKKFRKSFKTFEAVRSEWAVCAGFFRWFWFLHPHYSKAEAYRCALAIGQNIKCYKHAAKVKEDLSNAKRQEYYSGLLNTMLSMNVRQVEPSNDDAREATYYMYNDERLAQATLTNYFTAMGAKLGNYQDMIAFSKTWIVAASTSNYNKETFKQLSNIFSVKENTAYAKKRKPKKKPLSEVKLEWSRQPLTSETTREWQTWFDTHEDGNLHLRLLVKLQSKFRMKVGMKVRLGPRRTTGIFRPWSQLELKWSPTWRTTNTKPEVASGGFLLMAPEFLNSNEEWRDADLLQHLFGNVHNFRPEFPSLENVDDSVDNGKLRKVVGECNDMLSLIKSPTQRRKAELVCDLKKRILKAWKLEAEYLRCVELMTPKMCHVCLSLVHAGSAAVACHTCNHAIHIFCGYCYDAQPIDCLPCCKTKKTNPPIVVQNGHVTTVDRGGRQWEKLQLERYVLILNFVNCMMTKPGVTSIVHTDADIDPRGELTLTTEAHKVMIAVGMHDPPRMGGETFMIVRLGLQSWLTPYFQPSFVANLTIFYKLSTMGLERGGLSTIGTKVIERYYSKRVQALITDMKEEVLFLHEEGFRTDSSDTDTTVDASNTTAAAEGAIDASNNTTAAPTVAMDTLNTTMQTS